MKTTVLASRALLPILGSFYCAFCHSFTAHLPMSTRRLGASSAVPSWFHGHAAWFDVWQLLTGGIPRIRYM